MRLRRSAALRPLFVRLAPPSLGALLTSASIACSGVAPAAGDGDGDVDVDAGAAALDTVRPADGRGGGTREAPASKQAGSRVSAMVYHGGPIMLGATNVYYVWYGDWSSDTAAQSTLTELAKNLGGSPYYAINGTYSDGSGAHVANSVAYAGGVVDAYSRGRSLSDADVLTVVATAIGGGKLPLDAHGAYFVLTSADVTATSGFCTSYCGWHTHGTVSGVDVKYAFIGDPARCPLSCEWQSTGPNGGGGGDGMASIVAHELDEMVSDPDLSAWWDRRGQENADKCAWTFGTTYRASDGALANVRLGSRDYLIQQNWVNVGSGYCSMRYP
jgi:hypothetical protein